MKMLAPDLDRIIQNALLYVNPKSPRLVEVRFVTLNDKLHVYAADDYVVVTDSAPVLEGFESKDFSFSIDDTKKFGEWVKEDKKVVHKSEIDIKFRNTLVKLSSNDSDRELSIPILKEPAYKAWDLLFQLINEEEETVPMYALAYRPDRMAKLARLKADKEAPIDMRGIDINGHLVVQFKLGETISGAVVPIRRSIVDDRFLFPGETT
jgi:hypothetical protein